MERNSDWTNLAMSKGTFSHLPEEIMENILGFLSPEDLKNMSTMSQFWLERIDSSRAWIKFCHARGWPKAGRKYEQPKRTYQRLMGRLPNLHSQFQCKNLASDEFPDEAHKAVVAYGEGIVAVGNRGWYLI